MERTRRNLVPLGVALALAAATLIVYWQVRTFDFINFDDNVYVPENAHISGGLTRAGILWAFVTVDYFYWQPLTWLSHMLDCQLFGLEAGWHHLTNVLLHIANSLLVFFVFRRLTGAVWRSAMLAGLFALHPLRVESVAWIAERKDVLSCFWFLAALWAYVRYVERPSDRRYGCVLLAMLMGLMSKPMLVTVPFLFLLVDYWPLRRVAFAEKVPMLFLAAVASVVTAIGQKRMGAMDWSAGIPLLMRISNAVVSYVRYIGKVVWPENLAIFYPYPASIPRWQVAGGIALLLAITAAALWAGRAHRFFVTGWLWFVVGLVPAIGLVQVGRQAMADRFSYIPLIGLFAAVVWGGELLLRNHQRKAVALGVLVLAGCGVRSWQQTRTWRDSTTVFGHALEVTGGNSVAHRYLGAALAERGSTEEALPHLAEAVRLEPQFFIAHYDYGSALLKIGNVDGAMAQFNAAIEYRPNYGDAYYRLGLALFQLGKPRDALVPVREAIRLGVSPRNSEPVSQLLAQISLRDATR
ncbi:MAG TPA: tetratricopeptide repeat protein [Bryobacteraceae bacterium]|jgi:Flp pilus assembly protein TadD